MIFSNTVDLIQSVGGRLTITVFMLHNCEIVRSGIVSYAAFHEVKYDLWLRPWNMTLESTKLVDRVV